MKKFILFLKNNYKLCNSMLYHPKKRDYLLWTSFIFPLIRKKYHINICVVDEEYSKMLNMKYRKINRSTNVLSFPVNNLFFFKKKFCFIGEIVLCHTIIEKEAYINNKNLLEHWAHIVIHGYLHLLGYNHDSFIEYKKMQEIEIFIMQQLGYANPYINI